MAIVKSWSGLNDTVTALVELEKTDAFEYEGKYEWHNFYPDLVAVRLISGSPNRLPVVLAIYANPPYTTVKWGDGSTTTVKCCEDDTYSEAQGFAAALTKKLYGGKKESSSRVKKFVSEHVVRQQKKAKKKPVADNTSEENGSAAAQ